MVVALFRKSALALRKSAIINRPSWYGMTMNKSIHLSDARIKAAHVSGGLLPCFDLGQDKRDRAASAIVFLWLFYITALIIFVTWPLWKAML